MKPTALTAAAVALVVMACGVLLDRLVPARPEAGPAAPGAGSAGRFLSTGWYCPVPPGDGLSSLAAVTNLGDEPLRLRRWGVAGSAATPFQVGDLGPKDRRVVDVKDLGIGEGVAIIEAFGAATMSDALVLGRGTGVASTPCSVQPWTRWLFAVASTARGQDTSLLVTNPFEEEAVIRVRIVTPDADAVPARLKDLVIPPLSQTAVLMAEYYPETASFGMDVTAVRGRVVVSRFSHVATRDGLRGLGLELGLRAPAPRWQFAGGAVPEEGDEHIVLVNPTDREALVQVIFQTEAEQVGAPELAELPVPAARQVAVKVADFLPRGTRHGTTVASSNGVPIVAERQTIATVGGGRRVESTFGVAAPASRWALPVGSPSGGEDSLAITNTGGRAAVARVALITDQGEARPPELSQLSVEPGRRVTVDLTPFLGGGMATALVESAGAAVTVEHHLVLGEPYRDFADGPGRPL